MNDNDIKKALECCKRACVNRCEGCPYRERLMCALDLRKDALYLINRQQAEIEGAKLRYEEIKADRDQEHQYAMHYARMCAKAKSEAIKEFAEKVETELDERVSKNIRERNPHWYLAKRIVRETSIEMTEVQENRTV